MKEFLDVSLFGGAVLSLVAYEIGLILKKKFTDFLPIAILKRM